MILLLLLFCSFKTNVINYIKHFFLANAAVALGFKENANDQYFE